MSTSLKCRVDVPDWEPLGSHSIQEVTYEYVDTNDCSVALRPPGAFVARLQPSPTTDAASTASRVAYLHITAPSGHRFRYIRCACTAAKLELFTGAQSEYQCVVHGTEAPNGREFDVPLRKLAVQQVALKMFPIQHDQQRSFDIHELQLHLDTESVAVADSGAQPLGASGIDMRNVQAMLDAIERPLSEPSERFRRLLAIRASAPSAMSTDVLPGAASAAESVGPSEPSNVKAATVRPAPQAAAVTLGPPTEGGVMAALMRQHLAAQLQALEMRIADRIGAMERRIDEKLDGILAVLQTVASEAPKRCDSSGPVDADQLD